MKKTFAISALLVVAAILIVISCSRNSKSPAEVTDQFSEAENDVVFEIVLQKIDDQINKEISMLEKFDYNLTAAKSAETEPCSPVITIETPPDLKFPKTITLDYGTGCIDPDGNFRAGQIIVHITGKYWVANTVRHSKLVDYVYNDLKIAGERHHINKGTNDDGYYIFEVKNDEKIWNTEGELLVDRSWDKTRTYNRGEDLTTNEDDEVWVTGSAKVVKNEKDIVKIKEITTPLYRKISCQNFQSGVVTTFIKKEKVAELNYGDGECDNIAIWTNGEITKTITLKPWLKLYQIKP